MGRLTPLPPAGSHATNPFAQASTWTCAYCGRENHGTKLICAGCQAGKQVRTARVRETTWKGVPLSKLTEDEREEMAEWMTGPEAWRWPPQVLDADMESRVLALWEARYEGPESWSNITVLGSGESYDGFIESGKVSPRRQLLNRIKQFVGLQ